MNVYDTSRTGLDIILSIHRRHTENILNGVKRFEFRKTMAKDVKRIFLYETAPTKKVVGWADVDRYYMAWNKDSVDEIWSRTEKAAGITKDEFYRYFNSDMAFCYVLGKTHRYDTPKDLLDFGIEKAPQSFAYVRDGDDGKTKERLL